MKMNKNKIRFYIDETMLNLAFNNEILFRNFTQGMKELGAPFQDNHHNGNTHEHLGFRLTGQWRISILRSAIQCFSCDGDWQIFIAFEGKFNLSIEIKDDSNVVVTLPEMISELSPYSLQDNIDKIDKAVVVKYISKVIGLKLTRKRDAKGRFAK